MIEVRVTYVIKRKQGTSKNIWRKRMLPNYNTFSEICFIVNQRTNCVFINECKPCETATKHYLLYERFIKRMNKRIMK